MENKEVSQLDSDIERVIEILPPHYTVKESKTKGSIHCFSDIGIRKGVDAEDPERWGRMFESIKKHFGSRFREVCHNVCFCHTDFTIYLKSNQCAMAGIRELFKQPTKTP